MSCINGLGVFPERIILSTKKDIFEGKNVTFAINIKKISNTTAKPSFIKKIFNKMERFSTFFMISQTGRMGISNRKDDIGKYNEKIDVLKNRREVKFNKIHEDTFSINREQLNKSLDFKKDILVESYNVNSFITLIENENSSFKDRYSFFNYLIELQRAESFCRQSKDIDDNQFADVFKNILEERLGRIKKEDINKIFSEVVIKYKNETQFKNKGESTLANFSSNQDKEKFMSKINFLVSLSEYNPSIMNQVFAESFPEQLQHIMHEILNEEHSNYKITLSSSMVKDAWIKEYMNEYYGREKKITTQSIGVNTDSNIEVQNRDDDTVSVNSSGYRDVVDDNVSDSISDITSVSTLSDDYSSIHSSDYNADISHNGSELRKNEYISSIDELNSILKEEYPNLLTNGASAIKKNNMQEAIRDILSKLYDLSSIVTESLASPQSEKNELIISLDKITSMSNIIHSVQEVLSDIDPNYSLDFNKNIYNKFKKSIENIAIGFEIIGDKIESFNEDNTASIEIKKLLSDILNKISYTSILERKNWLDKIQVSINDVINRYRLTDKDNYSINKLESNADFLNQEELFSDPLLYNDELLIPFDFSSTKSIMNNVNSILKRNEGDYSYNEKKESIHKVEHDQNEVIKENESGRDEVGEFKKEIEDIDELIKISSKRKELLEKISNIDSEIKNNLKK